MVSASAFASSLSRRLLVAAALALAWAAAPAAQAEIVAAQSGAPAADRLTSERIAQAIVTLRAQVPSGARSAARLGTTREGAGTLVRLAGQPPGLIVTASYLIMEASVVEVTDHAGRRHGADVVGFDHASGLGLLRLVGPADLPALEIGESRALAVRQPVMLSAGGGVKGLQPGIVASLRAYVGSWEYLLDRAIFVAPPIDGFAGAALMDGAGKLVGVGSLLVNDAAPGQALPGNVFVPADLLAPIVADLLAAGRPKGPSRPWLGVNADDLQGGLVILGSVSADSPARKAGLRRNDVVLGVAGQPVKGLADFYRRVWSLGEAGVEVPLKVMQRDGIREVRVKSEDRYSYLRPRQTY